MHDAPDQYKRFSYSASAAFLLFYFPWEIIARFGYSAPYLMLKKDIYALFHENEGHFLPILSNFVHNWEFWWYTINFSYCNPHPCVIAHIELGLSHVKIRQVV